MREKFDFSGWATKNNILCADGRTILRDAFEDNDGKTVPLVWNHQHNDTKNVLGHALLENRPDGVYAYCSLNNTESGNRAKEFIKNKDVCALSIYANQLKQHGSAVVHGVIREVSLVLAGANPGACIDNVIMHGEEFDDMAVIYSGEECDLSLMHSEEKDEEEVEETVVDIPKKKTKKKVEVKEESEETDDEETEDEESEETEDESVEPKKKSKELAHSDNNDKENKEMANNSDKTVQEVFDTLTEEQKTVVYALIGAALEEKEGENENMKHNLFDDDYEEEVLTHAAMSTIIEDGKRFGSLKESFLAHADEYGIENIDWLFPDYHNLENQPGFVKRTPDEWVSTIMGGVKKTPFSRIKMMFADLREDDARAKGYIKGKLKKEEVFSLLKRTVDPTTIYKKQKIDRDDVIDITDFDVVSWLKGEMRTMLDEEIARAIVFGDGRSSLSEDKISETNIIPIVKDSDLYAIKSEVNPESGESLSHAIIKAAVKGQDTYEGSGNTILFTSVNYITDMLLEEDKYGHRLYKDLNELALAMFVNKIVKVPATIMPEGIYGVIVDLKDYNVGADKGGSVNMFDDFDIDYNQQKYLIETRCSGALIKPFSAVVLKAPEARG